MFATSQDVSISLFPSTLFVRNFTYEPDITTLQNDKKYQDFYKVLKNVLTKYFPDKIIRCDDNSLQIDIMMNPSICSLIIRNALEKDNITIPDDQFVTGAGTVASYNIKWDATCCLTIDTLIKIRSADNGYKFCQARDAFFSTPLLARPKLIVSKFSELLNSNFIIGNAHEQLAHFQFLTTNMPLFKERGYDTLFVEFLPYEIQKILDDYFHSSSDMLPTLKQYIGGKWPHSHFSISSGNDFIQLIQSAKQCGIRVVGLENSITSNRDQKNAQCRDLNATESITRYTDFNYSASQIIQKETQEGRCRKWIAHMGNAHIETYQTIPGLSELTGASALYVFDDNEKLTTECKVNSPFTVLDHQFSGQFILHAKPGTNLGMRTLCPDITSNTQNLISLWKKREQQDIQSRQQATANASIHNQQRNHC